MALQKAEAAYSRQSGVTCLLEYPDRFVIGSDAWIPERWISYDQIMATYRGWLAQLPPEQARLIAHGNAERFFKGRPN